MEKVALFERKTTAYYFYSAVASIDVAVAVLAPTKEIQFYFYLRGICDYLKTVE